MSNCIVCEKEFKTTGKGSGGHNRIICFDCLPNGLDRKDRDQLRNKLYHEKSNRMKLKLGCSICGYKKSPLALEWHHPDSSNKDMAPSDHLKRSWIAYANEIEKCILVCANCHREIHDKDYTSVG